MKTMMKPLKSIIFSGLLGLTLSFPVMAEDIAKPTYMDGHWQVIDGDTIRHGETVIRLWGIDAPEINQRCLKEDGSEYKCGHDAKTALELLIKDDPLVCEFINRDQYKRQVARCFHKGVDIGGLMISLGQALEYEEYSRGFYSAEQFQAQKKGLGVWEGEFEKLKDYRKGKRGV